MTIGRTDTTSQMLDYIREHGPILTQAVQRGCKLKIPAGQIQTLLVKAQNQGAVFRDNRDRWYLPKTRRIDERIEYQFKTMPPGYIPKPLVRPGSMDFMNLPSGRDKHER